MGGNAGELSSKRSGTGGESPDADGISRARHHDDPRIAPVTYPGILSVAPEPMLLMMAPSVPAATGTTTGATTTTTTPPLMSAPSVPATPVVTPIAASAPMPYSQQMEYAAPMIQPSMLPPEGTLMMQPHPSTMFQTSVDPETVIKMAAQLPGVSLGLPLSWDGKLEQLRSVYLGNIPVDVSNAEIIGIIGAGALEKIRRFTTKKYVILTFIKHESALRFYAEFYMNPCELHGQALSIGWVNTPPLTPEIADAVENRSASRNVYLEQHSGEIASEEKREAQLTEALSEFGSIENFYSLPNRPITFAYFTSITSAIAAVDELSKRSKAGDEKWKHFTVAFGKDPCQSLLKLKKQAALLYLGRSPYDTTTLSEYDQSTISKAVAYQSLAAVITASLSGGDANIGNRCIYIGSCPSNTRLVDICNTVRGGMIENIQFLSDKGICFVTFLEACAAAQFYATYQLHRLLINGKQVKVAWGKHSGPLDPEIEKAISRGVTRNICIKDARPWRKSNHMMTEAEILEKFAAYGPIEQIKMSPELGCIFITFVSIAKTMQAVEWAKANRVVPYLHIQYGKDRCATYPRFLAARDPKPGTRGEGGYPHSRPCAAPPVLAQYLQKQLYNMLPQYSSQSHNAMAMYGLYGAPPYFFGSAAGPPPLMSETGYLPSLIPGATGNQRSTKRTRAGD